MKEKLDKFMDSLKKQNPNANWANLLTGVAILVMVSVFSYAYFTKSKTRNVVINDDELVKQVAGNENENGGSGSEKETGRESGAESKDAEPAQSPEKSPSRPEAGEKGAEPAGGVTIVQKGEGLWHVAQRVCGDGEKYNVLAAANGLSVWEELNEGMTLKVVCK